MKIVLATGNADKVREIQKIMAKFPQIHLELQSLKDLQDIPEPEEPYEDFMANAQHKAKYYSAHTGIATLSEDSGLSFSGLNGFPGVRTKEFTQEVGGIQNAFVQLASMLKEKDQHATYTCAATIYLPQQDKFISYAAKCEGQFTYPPRGANGFGHDPIFIPQGYNVTMAELDPEIKNQISHRARAIHGLLQALTDHLQA